MQAERFYTHSLRDPRVARILAAALGAAEPGAAVERYLSSNPLPPARRVFALGLGKAAVPMTRALSRFTNLTRAVVITKHASPLDISSAIVMESGHPVPDARSLAAGKAALKFVSDLGEEDLLVCLISGGGSALMTAPVIPLADVQALTSALLDCGARIDEINTLRRHLDQVKGGGLARACKARVLSLILSDVVGNPLEAIASGPTTPDPTTREDALAVLYKYRLLNQLTEGSHGDTETRRKIEPGIRGSASQWQESVATSVRSSYETPKHDDPIFSRVQNVIVGDNALAIQAALRQAEKEGFQAESLGSGWQGEAREVGAELAQKLRVTNKQVSRPFCLTAGGETTVSLSGAARPSTTLHSAQEGRRSRRATDLGKGGRNQELALAAVVVLARLENVMLISLATDGEDGPTDAAGAVVTGGTLQRARSLGLDPADYLARNDSYTFFDKLGDLIKTGPTGTNVNDLVFLLRMG